MAREERDPQDARTTRSSRRNTPSTERLSADDAAYGEPVNPGWRGARTTGRNRRTQGLPSSRQEFVLWLQYGGWRILLAVIVVVVVMIGLIYLTRMSSDAKSAFISVEATSAPLIATLPTVTPAVVSPTLTLAPDTSISANGAQFRVSRTGTDGLFLRPDHSVDGTPLKTLPEDTVVTVIGPDFSGPDRVWKHVRDASGAEGWVAADFLDAVP